MGQFFIYTRIKNVAKKDENGKVILKKDQEGKEIPGQAETEEVKFRDIFNLNKIIRVHMLTEENVIVLLDDGHESTDIVPVLRNKTKPPTANNIAEEKQRTYKQSEINIIGADVARLYAVLEKA